MSITSTYVIRVLQMLEALADTIEYAIFALPSGIAFNRVLQSLIEVLQVQLNMRFAVNNRIRVLQSILESCLKILVLQSIIESRFAVNN